MSLDRRDAGSGVAVGGSGVQSAQAGTPGKSTLVPPVGGDNDPLKVDRGQLTFDAEGTEGGRYHSRTAHWPGGSSGVTIGRGYDFGQQTAPGIRKDLVKAGIAASDAEKFIGATGLKGNAARDWLKSNKDSLPEIGLEQQESLFEIAYKRLAADVERISNKYADTVSEETGKDREEVDVDWDTLHPAIRDTLIDLRYRGDYTPATRKKVQPPASANDLRALHEVMSDRTFWSAVPEDRFKRRVKFLTDALAGAQPTGVPETDPETDTAADDADGGEAAHARAGAPVAGDGGGSGGGGGGDEVLPATPAELEGDAAGGGGSGGGDSAAGETRAGAPPTGASAELTVTASSLNVRTQADAGSAKLGSLARGSRVTGTPSGASWFQIPYQNQTGFVSSQFVTTGGGASQQPRPAAEKPAAAAGGDLQRSGAGWVKIANANGWSNSTDFSALDGTWGPKAKAFVEGLRAAGAHVSVTAGLRHPNRAFLMHYAWGVASGQYTPAAANTACRGRGIQIEWDHGSTAASRAAAQALVSAFSLVHQASITSNHVKGLAIDIEISALPASITLDGETYTTKRGASGAAAAESVAPIGRAMGVIWYGAGDRVHWSHNGR